MAFLDKMKYPILEGEVSQRELRHALIKMKRRHVNRLCKATNVDHKGRKANDINDLIESIEKGENSLDEMVRRYNGYALLREFRIDKAQDILPKLLDAAKNIDFKALKGASYDDVLSLIIGLFK